MTPPQSTTPSPNSPQVYKDQPSATTSVPQTQDGTPKENHTANKPEQNPISQAYTTSIQQYNPPVVQQENVQPPPTPQPMPDETALISKLKSLRATGGIITLESSLTIIGQDVILPSNIELRGENPQITLFLTGKNLQVPANAQNISIKNLIIDGTNLGERFGLVIGQNASNIEVDSVAFNNYITTRGSLINLGNNVTINKASFTNVRNAYPIQNTGSDVNITNSNAGDNSIFSFVSIGGGIYNVNVVNNSVINRPLFSANYAATPAKNILIENNTNYFPNATYGILIRGGINETTPVPNENVTVKGNSIFAAQGAWNAIAIYGLTRFVLVINNTVDMTQSGHNAIGISSGINVTVTLNTVYGCTESTEGGIEVESNPVHNRAVGISENVTVTNNTVYNSYWGIYVRIMAPDHPNWNGTLQRSKNIIIENNTVFSCNIGVNLLYGEQILVKGNNIAANTVPFKVDPSNVFNYTVVDNIGFP